MDLNNKSDAASTEPSNKFFTASERISELNKIDESISTLLASASEAIGLLAGRDGPHTSLEDLNAVQVLFRNSAATYYSTLSSVEVRLRRQVYALEEAGLIESGTERDARNGRTLNSEFVGRNGGGLLDPSWLNARIDNPVERGMERETLQTAKTFLNEKGHSQNST